MERAQLTQTKTFFEQLERQMKKKPKKKPKGSKISHFLQVNCFRFIFFFSYSNSV